MAQGLPVSRLINVAVSLTPAGAAFANLSTLLLLGSSDVIDTNQRFRLYSTISGVAADFPTTAPEYLAALLWFSQTPAPTSLMIGRWAKTATSGRLYSGTFSVVQQAALLTSLQADASGGFQISVDGTNHTLTALNFTGITNLNGAASVIQTALTGTVVTWNASSGQFQIESGTSGAASAVLFATPATTGTDLSAVLQLTAATGASEVAGIVAETAIAAVELFDINYSSQWYALEVIGTIDTDIEAISAYIEAATSPSHYYGITTSEAAVLSSSSTTDIASILKASGRKKTGGQYSSTTPHAFVSALARILTTNWQGNNTAITLMYKQEPGVTAETLNTTQIAALEAKNINVSVNYNNGTAILETGTSFSGDFVDTVIGIDWLANQIQTNVYNLLFTTTTKIPQTDAGSHLIATAIQNACAQGVNNGLLAPGTWNSGGFGQLQQGQFLSTGFYIYTPPISSQPQNLRAARQSVPFQIAAKLAGAVHDVQISLNVNQ